MSLLPNSFVGQLYPLLLIYFDTDVSVMLVHFLNATIN